jgi:hypothetical protein
LGVSELPQDIKSRADVMFVDYPPFEDSRGFFHPDEALILKDYVSSLSELSNEEFVYLWYALINQVETPQAKRLINPTRERHIYLLFELTQDRQPYKEGIQGLSKPKVRGARRVCVFHQGYHPMRQKVRKV